MYFVVQKKHGAGGWDSGVVTKDSEGEAMHQFHAFLSTYAYGQSDALDYVACSVETDDGRTVRSEIDDRRTGA